jgi:hypothetical protein
VLIEYKVLSQENERSRDEKEKIRGVGRVKDIESFSYPNPKSQEKSADRSPCIFDQIPGYALSLPWLPVAIHLNAIDGLKRFGRGLPAFGADYADIATGLEQRGGFLSYSSVFGERHVLYKEDDARSTHGSFAPVKRCFEPLALGHRRSLCPESIFRASPRNCEAAQSWPLELMKRHSWLRLHCRTDDYILWLGASHKQSLKRLVLEEEAALRPSDPSLYSFS